MKIYDNPMNIRILPVQRPPHKGISGSWSLFLILALLLSGCAAPAPKVTYGQREDMPPVITTTEQAQPSVPAQPPLPSEQELVPPADQDLSREPLPSPNVEVIPARQDGAPAARQIKYIEKRLALYEKKFQQWLELHPQEDTDFSPWPSFASDSCLDKFDALLSGYSELRDQLRSGLPTGESAKQQQGIHEMLQLDIAFLESDCENRVPPRTPTPESGRMADEDPDIAAAHAERLINQYFSEEDYEQVIAVYQLLIKTYPAVVPSPVCTKQYGLARLHTGDIEEAADVFRTTLTELDPKNQILDPYALQRLTADLLLAEGKPAEAQAMYEKLLASSESFNNVYTWATYQLALIDTYAVTDPQMTYYLDLLRAALIFDRKNLSPLDLLAKADKIIRTFPNTPVSDNALQIRQDIENQLREWIDTSLTQVDRLVAKKEFQPALTLLTEISAVRLPAYLQEQVQMATDAVRTAAKQEEETQRLLREQSLAMQWKSSNESLDSQHYDSAIAGFAPLLDTPYDAEARQKIQEATNLAAAAQRKEAATLFIRAIKASSPENKKELLLESRRLLQDILRKYPEADIIDKVAQNLTTLEQHMQQIDPALLEDTNEDDMKDAVEGMDFQILQDTL